MMKNMRNKQNGIGFLGWSTILAVLAFFVLCGLRAFPLYSEKLTVITAMKSVANQPEVGKKSVKELRTSFRKNIEISSNSERFSELKVLKELVKIETDKKTKKKYIHVVYEGRQAFVKDLTLLLIFDHRVELGGSDGE